MCKNVYVYPDNKYPFAITGDFRSKIKSLWVWRLLITWEADPFKWYRVVNLEFYLY